MLSSKLMNFMKALKSNNVKKLDYILELGRVGTKIAEEYSTRFDLIKVDQCFCLSEFQTPKLEKAEKHLLNLVKINDPLFSLMEYYDNYPYAYSDANYLFKGCLKSGVEISIKAINPSIKNNYLKKIHKLKKSLKFHTFFNPWLNKEYNLEEILRNLEECSSEKFDLKTEIKNTKIMIELLNQHSDISFLKRVRFPKIYAYLSSDKMIVSEYIYGTYFYELLNYRKLAYKDVLDLIRIQLFFMLKVGIFHNNLHSGNLILGDDGNIYFLDCNNISLLSQKSKEEMFKILKAISKKDFSNLALSLNNLSTTKLDEKSIEQLTKNISYIFSINSINNNILVKKIMEIFKVATNNGITFEKEIFSTFKSFIYLDKLVEKTKNKNLSFLEDLKKILDELTYLL